MNERQIIAALSRDEKASSEVIAATVAMSHFLLRGKFSRTCDAVHVCSPFPEHLSLAVPRRDHRSFHWLSLV